MPPKSEPSTRDTATMDVKPKMETKPTVKAELPQDVKAELPQDVKPDITALENDSKPSLSHLEDEAGQKDIKPAIPGLKPQGVDFKPVRHVERELTAPQSRGPNSHLPVVERYPGHFKIIIMGNKDGAEYRIKYMVAPATTVHWLKVGRT